VAVDLSMSKLGPEMESGTLTEWLVSDGDVVAEGQPVATVETDKVTTELEAAASGPIMLLAQAGAEYPVGTRLAAIGADAETGTPAVPESRRGEPLATPVARRMAHHLGIALADVRATANGKVIRKRDIEAAHAAATAGSASGAPAVRREARATDLTPMRTRIAQRMHDSLLKTAQITDFREHEVTELIDLRRAGVAWADALGFRVSFTDLFVRATALALREVPALNASLTDQNRLLHHDAINIGIAVALPEGLIVPVLRDVDQLHLAAIHERTDDLFTRAREGRLTIDEVSGGTFTLTNIGSYGSHAATPILVEGQVGILATGSFLQKPVVRDGALAVGTVMQTSLTIDHRVVDGQTAGDFQTAWGQLIADPSRLL
jgi:pyruvate/2-oxoglutarate dehydrogenase complex dihydrolipoamide acyltransferase (E2) component